MRLHIIQVLAYIVIIAAGMKLAAPVINIILISLLLTMTILPLQNWLMKKGLPKSLSVLLTIVILILITTLITSLLSVAITGIVKKSPEYQQNLASFKLQIQELLSLVNVDVTAIFEQNSYNPERILLLVRRFIAGIISTFSNFTFVFLLVIFILIDTAGFFLKLEKSKKNFGPSLKKIADLADEIRKYVSITAYTGVLTAVGNLILMIILGVDFPVLWAFLSFLFTFIPNIGFMLSMIPPAFLALGESGITAAIIIVIGFIVINTIVDNIIKPKFLGEELNLSLTVIFISLIIWTWILGPVGAILAIPLTISVIRAWEVLSNESSGLLKGEDK